MDIFFPGVLSMAVLQLEVYTFVWPREKCEPKFSWFPAWSSWILGGPSPVRGVWGGGGWGGGGIDFEQYLHRGLWNVGNCKRNSRCKV